MAKYNKTRLQGVYRNIVRAISGLKKIQVRVQDSALPHYDTKNECIVMPSVISYATNDHDDFIIGRGIMVHECSHVLFCPDTTQMYDKAEKLGWNTKELAEWFNVFIDCNNEYKLSQVFPHLRKPLADKTLALHRSKPEVAKTDNPFMQVLGRCDMLCRDDKHGKMIYPDGYHKLLKNFVDRTVKKFNDKRIYLATGDNVIEFVKDVYKDWAKVTQQKNKKPLKYKQEMEKLMKDLGKAIKNKDNKGVSEIEKAIQELKDSVDTGEWFKDGVDSRKLRGTNNANAKIEEDYSQMTLDEIKKMLEDVGEQEFQSDGASGCWGTQFKNPDHVEVKSVKTKELDVARFDIDKAKEIGDKINRQLRKRLKLEKDFENKHKNGRLDIAEVRRQIAQFGRVIKTNIFKRDDNYKQGKLMVEVLLDCSGSMQSTGKKKKDVKQSDKAKIEHGRFTLGVLEYAFRDIPYIDYVLTGYSEFTDTMEHVVKGVKDKSGDSVIKRINGLDANGGNCDGYNIRHSVKRLLRQRNRKRLLIVISDGQPAYSNGIEDCTEVVKRAKEWGVEVIGIGVTGCSPQALKVIYPTLHIVQDIDGLHAKLTKIILNKLNKSNSFRIKRAWE